MQDCLRNHNTEYATFRELWQCPPEHLGGFIEESNFGVPISVRLLFLRCKVLKWWIGEQYTTPVRLLSQAFTTPSPS